MKKTFQTPVFQLNDDQIDYFVNHFDGNPVHRKGNSNEILPEGTVPGLMLGSVSFKKVLELPGFENILCAKEVSIKFQSPGFRTDAFFVRGEYEDSPHRTRPGVVFRTGKCELINAKTNAVLLTYELDQLLKA